MALAALPIALALGRAGLTRIIGPRLLPLASRTTLGRAATGVYGAGIRNLANVPGASRTLPLTGGRTFGEALQRGARGFLGTRNYSPISLTSISGRLLEAGVYGEAMRRAGMFGDTAASAPDTAAAAPAAGPATPGPWTPPGPVGDMTPGGAGGSAGVMADADTKRAALDATVDGIVGELRAMYQLSETEDEKERLRFMLADIEAQREAGIAAISAGAAATIQGLKEREEKSRAGTTQAVSDVGATLGRTADTLAANQQALSQEQIEANRGLGLGATVQPATNYYVDALRSMIPVEQTYQQRLGDITAEGIASQVGLTGNLEAALQGDLMRQASATRAGTLLSHSQSVQNRIDAERAALNQAMLQIQLQQMQESGAYNRALLSSDASQTGQKYWSNRFATAQQWGKAGVTGQQFAEAFLRVYGVYPQPDEYRANENGKAQMDFEMGRLGTALSNYAPGTGASVLNPALQGLIEGR
jgi:hypothetical protein